MRALFVLLTLTLTASNANAGKDRKVIPLRPNEPVVDSTLDEEGAVLIGFLKEAFSSSPNDLYDNLNLTGPVYLISAVREYLSTMTRYWGVRIYMDAESLSDVVEGYLANHKTEALTAIQVGENLVNFLKPQVNQAVRERPKQTSEILIKFYPDLRNMNCYTLLTTIGPNS